jgi:hypothetical protein
VKVIACVDVYVVDQRVISEKEHVWNEKSVFMWLTRG